MATRLNINYHSKETELATTRQKFNRFKPT
jgi:hypothetical protein